MAQHNFRCRDCEEKFSIERVEVLTTELKKVFCPGCGKQWGTPEARIELDVSFSTVKNTANIAKGNIEASQAAQRAAAEDLRNLNQIDPPVDGNMGPGAIRKSHVDTIAQRLQNLL